MMPVRCGQLGYRWQANQFVFGLEAQGDWAASQRYRSGFLDPHKNRWHRPFHGQIGYAWNAALLYVKGGAAVTSNRFSILDTLSGAERAAATATRWGGDRGRRIRVRLYTELVVRR